MKWPEATAWKQIAQVEMARALMIRGLWEELFEQLESVGHPELLPRPHAGVLEQIRDAARATGENAVGELADDLLASCALVSPADVAEILL